MRQCSLFFTIFLFSGTFLCAQLDGQFPAAQSVGLQKGVELYGQGQWGGAIVELRRAQSETRSNSIRSEAQFWIAMSELAAGKYREAIHNFDEIAIIDPLSPRRLEVPYQKARALFQLGMYNEAIVLFKEYADSIQVDGRYIQGVRAGNWSSPSGTNDAYNRKSSAIYWIGECLYKLEQWDRSGEMFGVVVDYYPKSTKYETSMNRLALIKQKKIEGTLLEIIKQNSQPVNSNTSRGAAVKNTPANSYEDAVLAYKNSIAPFLIHELNKTSAKNNEHTQPHPVQPQPPRPAFENTAVPEAVQPDSSAVPEMSGADLLSDAQLDYAPQQEDSGIQPGYPDHTVKAEPAQTAKPLGSQSPETMMRLLNIKTQALEMMDRLVSTLKTFESFEQERW
ncbi:MAG: tetratricopeptide repeat protein [Spirochaetaceae bacterium]|jgi:tetratricopeptide (TPR) repeat protein|nr:tetratricopeptide repeat protein [Spirochaetaceae bacterium]